ncbi:NmrA family NAD(P)-binding protein [Ciceribacter sp. L1K22]|uniref:NmrA family NAD(P)-binding protein n=1 Tax=Ciceribacter sp. L1K22 TaxID=2820275 RepID=UPI001ABE5BFD|nr:NmrA family NAD(P)-binding protein [Ciceribacter sp. L1K22]MBO3759866.1 NmrA family NAD(P)-binding protein [Ciceribacter sp. L1K22]
MRILVNTPAGNIGRVLVDRILSSGHDVTMISRNPAKVQDFVARGARLVEGSIDEVSVLREAVKDVDVLYWLPPLVFDQPDFLSWSRECGSRIADIAGEAGIRRAVLLSSVGAQHDHGVGPIACLPAIERSFRDAFPDMTSLRPGHFMENFLFSLASIRAEGAIYSSHAADQRIPMIATRDIADFSAVVTMDLVWKGHHTLGLHGPADLSYNEAATIIGGAIGKPVRYIQIDDESMIAAMAASGMPEPMARLVCGLYSGIRSGMVRRVEPRMATPTTLEQFARSLVQPAVAA